MLIPNAEKGAVMRDAMCPPGSSFDKIVTFRKAVKTALDDTSLSSASVCDHFIPLHNPLRKGSRTFDEACASELNDLIEQIEGSTDDRLVDIGQLHQWKVI